MAEMSALMVRLRQMKAFGTGRRQLLQQAAATSSRVSRWQLSFTWLKLNSKLEQRPLQLGINLTPCCLKFMK